MLDCFKMTRILASFLRAASRPFGSFEDGRFESRSSSVRPPRASMGVVARVERLEPFREVSPDFKLPLETPLVCQSFMSPEGLVMVTVSLRPLCCGLLSHVISQAAIVYRLRTFCLSQCHGYLLQGTSSCLVLVDLVSI